MDIILTRKRRRGGLKQKKERKGRARKSLYGVCESSLSSHGASVFSRLPGGRPTLAISFAYVKVGVLPAYCRRIGADVD